MVPPADPPPAHAAPWAELDAALVAMRATLTPPPHEGARLQAVAVALAGVVGAYLQAVTQSGRTSMRAEAAARALDLRTPKSALLHFLGRE